MYKMLIAVLLQVWKFCFLFHKFSLFSVKVYPVISISLFLVNVSIKRIDIFLV